MDPGAAALAVLVRTLAHPYPAPLPVGYQPPVPKPSIVEQAGGEEGSGHGS